MKKKKICVSTERIEWMKSTKLKTQYKNCDGASLQWVKERKKNKAHGLRRLTHLMKNHSYFWFWILYIASELVTYDRAHSTHFFFLVSPLNISLFQWVETSFHIGVYINVVCSTLFLFIIQFNSIQLYASHSQS